MVSRSFSTAEIYLSDSFRFFVKYVFLINIFLWYLRIRRRNFNYGEQILLLQLSQAFSVSGNSDNSDNSDNSSGGESDGIVVDSPCYTY